MKKIIIGIVLLGLIFGVGYSIFPQKTRSKENELVIGTAAGYAPFVSVDPQGNYEGFDIDVAHLLAQELNKELVINDLGSMVPLFTALDQGSIDAIIWGLSITQDRLKKVAMIRYQGDIVTAYPLIFCNEIPRNVKTIHDMKGMTVCCEPATSQEAVLAKYPFITIKPTEKIDDALLNLQGSKADAALVEPAIARKFQKKYPEIRMMWVELRPEDQVHGVGIAIKKKIPRLQMT
jgi:ABC-type amino acid transport substrate-binding protein